MHEPPAKHHRHCEKSINQTCHSVADPWIVTDPMAKCIISVNRPDPVRYFYTNIGGVGVFIPRDKLIRIGLFRSVNRPSVASESWPTPVTHWNFNTSGCDSKLNIILIGLTDDPSGQSVSAMYLMWLATQYTRVFRARVTVMTLSTWHSGPVVALR